MGDYSYSEHIEIFGGPPEPGEAYPDLEQVDLARKEQKENPPPKQRPTPPNPPLEIIDQPDGGRIINYHDGRSTYISPWVRVSFDLTTQEGRTAALDAGYQPTVEDFARDQGTTVEEIERESDAETARIDQMLGEEEPDA